VGSARLGLDSERGSRALIGQWWRHRKGSIAICNGDGMGDVPARSVSSVQSWPHCGSSRCPLSCRARTRGSVRAALGLECVLIKSVAASRPPDVCFSPHSGAGADIAALRLRATSGSGEAYRSVRMRGGAARCAHMIFARITQGIAARPPHAQPASIAAMRSTVQNAPSEPTM
jgi:hypothetical protein